MMNVEPKKGGVQSKQSLYQYASKYSHDVIDYLVATMNDKKKPDSVRVSAANKLLDKMLANLSENDVKVSGNYNVNIDGLIGLSKVTEETTTSDPAALEAGD